MRALADYVMKGRTQAVIAAVLATGSVLFAWVGAAVVALVTLRMGLAQGSKVLAWAMLPAVALVALGDTAPVTTLLGVGLAATVLRTTASWQWTLLAAVISGLLTALLMATLGRELIEALIEAFGQIYLEQLQQLLAQLQAEQGGALGEGGQPALPTVWQVAGWFGFGNATTVILCVLLARWWQAQLYNPGGFQQEFHQLRLAPLMTTGLLLVAVLLLSAGELAIWALIVTLPLVFAGLGLVHWLLKHRGMNSAWLWLFYITWLLLDPIKLVVIVLAVSDAWLNLRARWAKTSG